MLATVLTAVVAAAAPGQFSARSAHVTNPWFPLRPGTVYRYTGVKDGHRSHEPMTVTHRTRVIAGVRCVTIDDRLFLGRRLAERTTDWYAQDTAGDVWYYGENTAELSPAGKVTSTEGTWRAGLHGGRPGIFMPAHPHAGQAGRQEYLKGHAEDHYRVLRLGVRVTTPAVTSRHALLTQETTPLEPGVVDHKLYVRGIGTVLERTVQGGNERNTLVSVTRSR